MQHNTVQAVGHRASGRPGSSWLELITCLLALCLWPCCSTSSVPWTLNLQAHLLIPHIFTEASCVPGLHYGARDVNEASTVLLPSTSTSISRHEDQRLLKGGRICHFSTGLFWAEGNREEADTRKAPGSLSTCLKEGRKLSKATVLPSLPGKIKAQRQL